MPSFASSNHIGNGRVPASISSSPSVSYGQVMEQVGTVAELWRYPVKSMQGERVERLELAPGVGAVGDRTLAVVDRSIGKVLSAKLHAPLLDASARVEGDDVVVTLPDGSSHAASDPAVHGALSAWLDREVRLEAPQADDVLPFEVHAGLSDDTTPVIDWPGPAGTWLDLADVHWLTTASLAAAADLYPAGRWDVRRFRPTALHDVAGTAFVEDAWRQVDAGGARSEVLMPTMRCTMPSRSQPGLERDLEIGRTLREQHENNLGLYAKIVQAGAIAVGDAVRVE
jgi:uncharacterized protein YcbX